MSKANKRERQRQNREAARVARMQAEKRAKQRRLAVRLGIPLVLIVGLLFWLSNSGGGAKAPSGSPPLQIKTDAKYTATIATSEGTIVADLDVKNAKWGANNFITLARQGFYDGLTFHRAAKNFVIQGGDPKGDGSGGPGYTFKAEVPTDKYRVGDLAWAKTGADPNGSAGSQFFVITGSNALTTFNHKPYLYGYFGHVTKGLDVAQKIESYAPSSGDGPPTKPVKILKVTISGPAPTITTTTTASTSTTSTSTSTPTTVAANSSTTTAASATTTLATTTSTTITAATTTASSKTTTSAAATTTTKKP